VQSSKFELVINHETARLLGLAVACSSPPRGDRITAPDMAARNEHCASPPSTNRHSLECCDAHAMSFVGHQRRINDVPTVSGPRQIASESLPNWCSAAKLVVYCVASLPQGSMAPISPSPDCPNVGSGPFSLELDKAYSRRRVSGLPTSTLAQ
jgi:hypothetical protein